MKSIALVVLAFLAGGILCNTCEAMPIPLGEIQRSGGGGFPVISSEIEIEWWSGSDIPIEPIMTWGRFAITDVGSTVTLSSGTSAEFDHYAAMLTSGTDDMIWILAGTAPQGGRGGQGDMESHWLNKFVQSSGPDFYGYEVTGIALTLNAMTLDSPGSDPLGDGIWTDFAFDATFTIYGVPEPATLFLLGLGAMMLRSKRG